MATTRLTHFKFSLEGIEDDLLIFPEKVGGICILKGLPEETKQNVY